MSYTYLQDQGAESSAECYSDIPASVLLRLNLTPVPSSSNANATASSHHSLSGTISPPSTELPGEDQLRFWPEDFPVRTLAHSNGKNQKALKGSVPGYGERWRELSAKFNPVLSFWKIRHSSPDGASGLSSAIFPKMGMMRDGVLLEPTNWVLATGENESGLLPTCVATDYKGGTTAIRKDTGKQRLDQWRDYVKCLFGMIYPHPTHSELRLGFPKGWNEQKPLGTRKFQEWRLRHSKSLPMNGYRWVVFADECKPCECCDDFICRICGGHYADCDCPGPTQDDVIYKEINGVLYGKNEKQN